MLLSRYLTTSLPDPPESISNSRGVEDWGVFLNDRLGCCTISAVGHAVQVMVMSNILPQAKAGVIHPSDDIILRYYEQWDGYDPADPSTDRGGIELDVLNNWRKNGFAGYQLQSYVSINSRNTAHVMQAIEIFGGVYIGLELPSGWQNARVWDANMGAPGSWGGHAVFCPDYNKDGISPITWGTVQPMTWNGFKEYCSECYALIVPDWVPPAGFDLSSLQKDLKLVAG